MGGGGPHDAPMFEEAKVPGDQLNIIDSTYDMFSAHPVICCVTMGSFFLFVLIFLFEIR
jgi:hypothetical protein